MAKSPETNGLKAFRDLLSSPSYERLRGGLIRVFARRGCSAPEDLADETIARVMQKLPKVAMDYEGDPERYFFGVARNVYLEQMRRPRLEPIEDLPEGVMVSGSARATDEAIYGCLEACVEALPQEDRELVREYYRYEKIAQIEARRALAARLGVGLNALRLRVHRIRQQLARCVEKCRKKRS